MKQFLLTILLILPLLVHSAEFRLSPDAITVAGDIVPGDAATLQVAHWTAPRRTIIFEDNEGGVIAEALKMNDWLHVNRLHTHVRGYCRSACVYAFAGGVRRTMDPTAVLGVHQMWIKPTTDNDATMTSDAESTQNAWLVIWDKLESRGINAAAVVKEALKHPARNATFKDLRPIEARMMGFIQR
jgi:hypothetical protein